MNKKIEKAFACFTTIIVVLVVVVAIALVGVRLVGLQVFTVLSGSMEPTYQTGSLIYVDEVDYKTLKEGDVITYMLNENTIATHRIIEVVPNGDDPTVLEFRTKGDANDIVDGSLVHYKNIIGSPVLAIPKMGYLANYIQTPPGMYIAIAMGIILVFLIFIPDFFKKSENKK